MKWRERRKCEDAERKNKIGETSSASPLARASIMLETSRVEEGPDRVVLLVEHLQMQT